MNGGSRVAEVLHRAGVQFLFTLCGGHISPILVESKRLGIRVVDVRQEATAVFAADAVARLTGIPGVAAVTAGPGVTNTLTALENARLAQSPLVLIGGAAATFLKGRGALQDIDQMASVKPHVKAALKAKTIGDIVSVMEEALATSLEGVPGPVFVELPIDLLYGQETVREWYGAGSSGSHLMGKIQDWVIQRHVDKLFAESAPLSFGQSPSPVVQMPSASKVQRARELLKRSVKPVMILGSQAVQSPITAMGLVAALNRMEIPVYLSGMARGLLGAECPFQYRHKRREALREADLIVLAGVPADFRLDYGRHLGTQAKIISANLDRRELTRNRLPDVAALGDPATFLSHLADELGGACPACPEWRAHLRRRDEARAQQIESMSEEKYELVNPLALARTIDGELKPKSIIVGDGGDFVATASYVVSPQGPLQWLDPGVFGTLGVGAGFALGAKLVHPDADVWLLYGDGAAGYSIMEFDTFVRHELPVLAVVGNDACWSQIAREQVEILGDSVGTDLVPTRYDKVAGGLGARGLLVERDEEVATTLSEALTATRKGRPVLVNARIAKTDFRKGSLSM
jgi:acetolactate synthase-like protein